MVQPQWCNHCLVSVCMLIYAGAALKRCCNRCLILLPLQLAADPAFGGQMAAAAAAEGAEGDGSFREGRGAGAPPQRGLSSHAMARITSDCGAMRLPERELALIASGLRCVHSAVAGPDDRRGRRRELRAQRDRLVLCRAGAANHGLQLQSLWRIPTAAVSLTLSFCRAQGTAGGGTTLALQPMPTTADKFTPEPEDDGESWLTAAIPMENPCCSCRLTRRRRRRRGWRGRRGRAGGGGGAAADGRGGLAGGGRLEPLADGLAARHLGADVQLADPALRRPVRPHIIKLTTIRGE